MKKFMALIEEERAEVMDLEAFDRALTDYVVSFICLLYTSDAADD